MRRFYVYILSSGTWISQQKLTASDATPDQEYGTAVGISGDTIVIGTLPFAEEIGRSSSGPSAQATSPPGAAYAYARTAGTWAELQKLTPNSSLDGDNFGEAVSISGNTIAVGTPGAFIEPNDGQGNFQGSLAEHLFLNNAGQIRTLCQPRKGNLGEVIANAKVPVEERVDRLFLSVLSRPPSMEERTRFIQHLNGDAKMLPSLAEEAIWVLLSCSEFRFNR